MFFKYLARVNGIILTGVTFFAVGSEVNDFQQQYRVALMAYKRSSLAEEDTLRYIQNLQDLRKNNKHGEFEDLIVVRDIANLHNGLGKKALAFSGYFELIQRGDSASVQALNALFFSAQNDDLWSKFIFPWTLKIIDHLNTLEANYSTELPEHGNQKLVIDRLWYVVSQSTQLLKPADCIDIFLRSSHSKWEVVKNSPGKQALFGYLKTFLDSSQNDEFQAKAFYLQGMLILEKHVVSDSSALTCFQHAICKKVQNDEFVEDIPEKDFLGELYYRRALAKFIESKDSSKDLQTAVALGSPKAQLIYGMGLLAEDRNKGLEYLENAAQGHNRKAQVLLYTNYQDLIEKAPADKQSFFRGKALYYKEELLKHYTPEQLYAVSIEQMKKGQRFLSVHFCMVAADCGNKEAALACAKMYIEGKELEYNPQKAQQYIVQSALPAGEQYYNCGILHEYTGTLHDAQEWYKKAIEEGYVPALQRHASLSRKIEVSNISHEVIDTAILQKVPAAFLQKACLLVKQEKYKSALGYLKNPLIKELPHQEKIERFCLNIKDLLKDSRVHQPKPSVALPLVVNFHKRLHTLKSSPELCCIIE